MGGSNDSEVAIAKKSKQMLAQGLSGFVLKGSSALDPIAAPMLKDWKNGQHMRFEANSNLFSNALKDACNKCIKTNAMASAKNFRDILIHIFANNCANRDSLALFSFNYDQTKQHWYSKSPSFTTYYAANGKHGPIKVGPDDSRKINKGNRIYYNRPNVFRLWYNAAKHSSEARFIEYVSNLFHDGAIAGYRLTDFTCSIHDHIERCKKQLDGLVIKLTRQMVGKPIRWYLLISCKPFVIS